MQIISFYPEFKDKIMVRNLIVELGALNRFSARISHLNYSKHKRK